MNSNTGAAGPGPVPGRIPLPVRRQPVQGMFVPGDHESFALQHALDRLRQMRLTAGSMLARQAAVPFDDTVFRGHVDGQAGVAAIERAAEENAVRPRKHVEPLLHDDVVDFRLWKWEYGQLALDRHKLLVAEQVRGAQAGAVDHDPFVASMATCCRSRSSPTTTAPPAIRTSTQQGVQVDGRFDQHRPDPGHRRAANGCSRRESSVVLANTSGRSSASRFRPGGRFDR